MPSTATVGLFGLYNNCVVILQNVKNGGRDLIELTTLIANLEVCVCVCFKEFQHRYVHE